MLTTVLKNSAEKNCKCKIIKFVDRILLGQVGKIKNKTKVSRTLVVEVDKDSPVPLNEISIASLCNLQKTPANLTYTLLDHNYKLNSASSGNYTIEDINKGLIEYDGIDNIRVLRNTSISEVEKIGSYCLFTIYFNEPLKAGEKTAIRIHFELDHLAKGNSKFKEELTLHYFEPTKQQSIKKIIEDDELEIKCSAFYKTEKKLDNLLVYGGFDIILYVPADFFVIPNPPAYHNPIITQTDLDGHKGIERKVFIWRLRQFINTDEKILFGGKPDDYLKGYGININIHARCEQTVSMESNRRQFLLFLLLSVLALFRPEIIKLLSFILKLLTSFISRTPPQS